MKQCPRHQMLQFTVLFSLLYVFTAQRCVHDELHSKLPLLIANHTTQADIEGVVATKYIPVEITVSEILDGERTCTYAGKSVPVGDPRHPTYKCWANQNITHDCYYECTAQDVVTTAKRENLFLMLNEAKSFIREALLTLNGNEWLQPSLIDSPCDSRSKIRPPERYINKTFVSDSYILMLAYEPLSYLTGSPQAHAYPCQHLSNYKPIFGVLVVSPAEIPFLTPLRLIHELFHALGFSAALYRFLNVPGTDLPYATNPLVDNKTLVTPELQSLLINHFACNDTVGVEVDPTSPSHFKKTNFYYDMMTANVTNLLQPTKFSLGFMQDTGWYRVRYDVLSVSDYFQWGEGKGCEFLEKGACHSSSSWSELVCSASERQTRKCSKNGRLITKCSIQLYPEKPDLLKQVPIPRGYQWFGSEYIGGSFLADYCGVQEAVDSCVDNTQCFHSTVAESSAMFLLSSTSCEGQSVQSVDVLYHYGSIQSKITCETAAKSLGLPSNVQTTRVSEFPNGCYYKKSDNIVYWNTLSTATSGQPDVDRMLLCTLNSEIPPPTCLRSFCASVSVSGGGISRYLYVDIGGDFYHCPEGRHIRLIRNSVSDSESDFIRPGFPLPDPTDIIIQTDSGLIGRIECPNTSDRCELVSRVNFTRMTSYPIVTSVSPDPIDSHGNEVITVRGVNFKTDCSIIIAGQLVSKITVTNNTYITGVTAVLEDVQQVYPYVDLRVICPSDSCGPFVGCKIAAVSPNPLRVMVSNNSVTQDETSSSMTKSSSESNIVWVVVGVSSLFCILAFVVGIVFYRKVNVSPLKEKPAYILPPGQHINPLDLSEFQK